MKAVHGFDGQGVMDRSSSGILATISEHSDRESCKSEPDPETAAPQLPRDQPLALVELDCALERIHAKIDGTKVSIGSSCLDEDAHVVTVEPRPRSCTAEQVEALVKAGIEEGLGQICASIQRTFARERAHDNERALALDRAVEGLRQVEQNVLSQARAEMEAMLIKEHETANRREPAELAELFVKIEHMELGLKLASDSSTACLNELTRSREDTHSEVESVWRGVEKLMLQNTNMMDAKVAELESAVASLGSELGAKASSLESRLAAMGDQLQAVTRELAPLGDGLKASSRTTAQAISSLSEEVQAHTSIIQEFAPLHSQVNMHSGSMQEMMSLVQTHAMMLKDFPAVRGDVNKQWSSIQELQQRIASEQKTRESKQQELLGNIQDNLQRLIAKFDSRQEDKLTLAKLSGEAAFRAAIIAEDDTPTTATQTPSLTSPRGFCFQFPDREARVLARSPAPVAFRPVDGQPPAEADALSTSQQLSTSQHVALSPPLVRLAPQSPALPARRPFVAPNASMAGAPPARQLSPPDVPAAWSPGSDGRRAPPGPGRA